jgi:lamin tail-like protein
LSRAKLLFLAIPLLFPIQTLSQSESVIINEIAWMGTEESSNNEWEELYNNSDKPVNLFGWVLRSSDESLNILLKGTIKPKGYFLLERTDDNSVEEIKADQIYSGSLGNSGEKLELVFNNLVVDSIDCSLGWIKGNNETHQTMERIDPLLSSPNNWQTSEETGGTPKEKNSSGEVVKDLKQINYKKASLEDINLPVFLIALLVATLSGVIVLTIKRITKKIL